MTTMAGRARSPRRPQGLAKVTARVGSKESLRVVQGMIVFTGCIVRGARSAAQRPFAGRTRFRRRRASILVSAELRHQGKQPLFVGPFDLGPQDVRRKRRD